MGAAQPKNRPQNPQAWFVDRLQSSLKRFKAEPWDGKKLILFGCEAYYQLMGNPLGNDRGIYDDALCALSGSIFVVVNANLDPSGYRPGHGHGSAKGMGSIDYGFHKDAYAIGQHKAIYPAIRQVGVIKVRRDADSFVSKDEIFFIDARPYYSETGDYQAMNMHPGGINSTSSLGCQTVPRGAQWELFISAVVNEAKRLGQKRFSYCKDRVRG